MEDGSRLGRKDASMLDENTNWGLKMPLLFTHLFSTMFKTPFDFLMVF
jgi:hypothetical protein